ncbi:MAG: efflux RND transporter periplasmic adaptor subunit [Luteitalea sp.]|nr:efflux RND transporter periplasmic adaptor subunit [Luteitalea sp.]
MTAHTKRLAIVLVALVGLVAVGAGAYTFRARLAGMPLVGTLFQTGAESEEIWTCPMHPHIEEHGPGKCPECGMDLVPAADVTDAAAPSAQGGSAEPAATSQPGTAQRGEVNIDPRRQQLIGVRTAAVERKALTKNVRTVGVVRYDETRQADVNLKLAGWIEDLHVDYTGQFVKKGQPLFTIYSPELVTTQSEYLLALETRDQVEQSQIADAREYADRLVESAEQRLALWDLPSDQLQAIQAKRQPQRTLLFRSPVTGFVIEKHALQGMHVTPGTSLYKIADLSVVWVEADIYEREIPLVRVGAGATVTMDAYPGERFQGRVVYIYPYVEEKTRTVKVRFAFPNRGARLKPGMYTNVELTTPAGTGFVIPANALLDSGTQQVVFVAEGDGYFQPREVEVGQQLGEAVEILDGLEEGEQVATGAAFFIDAESQLRASLQGFETPPAAAAGGGRARLDITFRSQPDPPRAGQNKFEVVVRDPEGKPITDAQVNVIFYMAPMPSMNMPAMKTEATLTQAGGGVYRGTGEVTMAGRWDVTVTVMQNGKRLGSKALTVVAR